MATDLSGSNYSETDASNNNASPNGMPEGMAPSGVNDSWRQGMGAIKRAYDRDHAGSWCTVGGTANAITLTYSVGPASYVQGEKFAFKATADNTGATTINVNGLGAKNLFKKNNSGAASACIGAEIKSGDIVESEYDGTQFQLVSHPVMGIKAYGIVGTAGTTVGANYPSAGTSSVKNATGDYSITFGATMSNTSYVVTLTPEPGSGSPTGAQLVSRGTTSIRIFVFNTTTGAAVDQPVDYAIFGQLA